LSHLHHPHHLHHHRRHRHLYQAHFVLCVPHCLNKMMRNVIVNDLLVMRSGMMIEIVAVVGRLDRN
jgi:hypothetical protein